MAGGPKRTPPEFWTLFMVGGRQWEWFRMVDMTGDTGRGTEEGQP